jgi:uncharacterized MAPEG superfamily protein
MTLDKWCILIACFLPALTALTAKVPSLRLSYQDGKYDNNNPREWEARQVGWQKRALAAHANGYEALPLFIAGVVFAHLSHADQSRIDLLAMSFVGLRLAYTAAYLMNLGYTRSLIWTAAVGCCVALMLS